MLRFLVLVLLILLPVQASFAQSSLAIVDVRALLTDSKAAKDIQKQIKSKRDSFLKNLEEQEKTLRKQEKELIESQKDSDPEAFLKKRKKFEENVLKTRRKAEEKRRALEKGAAKASNDLRSEITKVVEAISEEKGYDLVLSAQNVVIGSNDLNITKDVMSALNKSVSSIKVKVD